MHELGCSLVADRRSPGSVCNAATAVIECRMTVVCPRPGTAGGDRLLSGSEFCYSALVPVLWRESQNARTQRIYGSVLAGRNPKLPTPTPKFLPDGSEWKRIPATDPFEIHFHDPPRITRRVQLPLCQALPSNGPPA